MKRYIVIFVLLAIVISELATIREKSAEVRQYKANTAALMTKCETYKADNKYNAAKVGTLELAIKEYEKYRADDAELIKRLKGYKDLAQVVTTASTTTADIRGAIHDSIIVERERIDTLQCVNVSDTWYTLSGCVSDGEFVGRFESRDSLLIYETIKHKRILWWRTKKIKSRSLQVISKNPHTKIQSVEHIYINRK